MPSTGGSSPAATPPSPPPTVETQTITEITQGQPAVVEFAKPNLDLTKITIVPTQTISEVSVTVTEITSLPEANMQIGLSTGEAYQGFEISTSGMKSTDIESATIEFNVKKNWLTEKNMLSFL